jgi:hypothetical protein
MSRIFVPTFLLAWLPCVATLGAEADLARLLAAIRAVGPEAAGTEEASAAWEKLAVEDAARLPEILAGMDGAGPLAANWIATASQAVVERQRARGRPLPAAALEAFVLDRGHSPQGRQLAYEILLGLDPKAHSRLIAAMLDDPCLEFRRLAVASLIEEGSRAAEAGQQDKARSIYRHALDSARDPEQAKLLSERLQKLGENVDLARHLGYLVHWKLIAPFDNSGRKGFDAVYAPEREFRPDAAYPGKKGEVRWIDFTSTDPLGRIDFFQAFGKQGEVVGYAATEFLAAQRQDVELRTSAVNATKIWVNGLLIGEHPIYHSGSGPDQYVDRVTLEAGRNLILVKCCQNEQTQDWALRWDFQLRVCDPRGNPVLSADREQR